MLIRISCYNNEGDATYSVLSQSEIYMPNLKYCVFKEHIQFEENGRLGLYIIALLHERKEAEKKMAATDFMSTAIISETTVSGSFPKLGNCSREETPKFPQCQGVNNVIFALKAQPVNAKVSLCFSMQFPFHEMKS